MTDLIAKKVSGVLIQIDLKLVSRKMVVEVA
jgi:hypothetical protein